MSIIEAICTCGKKSWADNIKIIYDPKCQYIEIVWKCIHCGNKAVLKRDYVYGASDGVIKSKQGEEK